MRRWLIAALAPGLLAGCTSPQPAADEGDQIAIASDFPVTGQDEKATRPLAEAVRYAVEHAKPPAGRYHLVYQGFDDAIAGIPWEIKGAQNVARMAADPRVMAMVGPYNSFVAAEEIPIAADADLGVISPTTTFDCLTPPALCPGAPARPRTQTYFRIVARDSDQGIAMAELAVNTLHLKRFAVLSEGRPVPYGPLIAAAFAREVTALGGTIVLNESYNPSDSDFSDVMSRAAAWRAEAVFVGSGFPPDCRLRAAMRGPLPSSTYFFGPDAFPVADCVTAAGDGADEHMVATVPVPRANLDDPLARRFLRDHRVTGVDPYVFAAYDCALIEIDAIQRAVAADGGKKPTREQVVQAIAATRGFHGVTGTWSFDANGDATAPGMSFYRVEGGKWVLWKSGTLGGTYA